jgi:hypothetical protein
MRLLQIRTRNNEDARCVMRELAVYSPRRSKRSILIELDDRMHTDLLAILAAVEACLGENDIPSVVVQLDGQRYMLAPQR